MIEYKVKEVDGEKIIVKTGDKVEFSFRQIDMDIAYLEKNLKEIEGKLGIEKATMANVARTHPHIAEMSQEDLTAAYLYRGASGFVSVADEKIAEIKKQLDDYATEKEEIIKQTGINPNE